MYEIAMDPVSRYIVSSDELVIPEGEVLRYLGISKAAASEADIVLVKKHTEEIRKIIAPKACYSRYEIQIEGDSIMLPSRPVKSVSLSKNLDGCSGIFIFAATIGIEFDRLLYRTKYTSMADAAVIQAVGAAAAEALVESLVSHLDRIVKDEGLCLKPRFSPGFGDFGLEHQKEIFSLLNPSKEIGLSLKDSFIMVPEKSVTALAGIYKKDE